MSKKNLASVLYDLRNDQGHTQADVARRTGYTQTVISQYENGTREPSVEAAKALAKFYNVKADTLLSLLGPDRKYRKLVLRQMEGMKEEHYKMIYEFIADKIGLS